MLSTHSIYTQKRSQLLRTSPTLFFIIFSSLLSISATSYADSEPKEVEVGIGPNPTLPEPDKSLLPQVNIAPEHGWPEGTTPTAAPGLNVNAFSIGLTHPRTLHVLPNGDVLVAETNGPAKRDEDSGIKGWFMKKVMKAAGAGIPSPNRISLLRDLDMDGIAETKTTFLQGLHSPFGMALIGNNFYVANTDAIVRYPYRTGDTQITEAGTKLADLPAGDINHHWTKDLVASPDGKYLYVSVGSNSNIAENGIENEKGRAAVHEVEVATGKSRIFATGLRNANGLTWQPQSGALWVVVNERDELGNDLVPDYMTSVQDGGFYGWPYSYFGQHVDDRVKPQNPDLVAKALAPDYALGSHTASLGLTFYSGDLFPKNYSNGAFIGQHGSWNRTPHSGYKVIFVPFADGKPSGPPRDILTGFLSVDKKAFGRPVGVAVDKTGAVLVADDVGNAVWRVTPAKKAKQITELP
ncbi:MAG: sorbosone dehydrogenase family protein [Gammaproteobacteria bacterium]|nr:MAG: sorbosone dehydrogenase family protein [Gammaproteobacteria bacterium]